MAMSRLEAVLHGECERCGEPTLGRFRYFTPLRPDGEPVPPARLDPEAHGVLLIPCRRPGCCGFAIRRVGRRGD